MIDSIRYRVPVTGSDELTDWYTVFAPNPREARRLAILAAEQRRGQRNMKVIGEPIMEALLRD